MPGSRIARSAAVVTLERPDSTVLLDVGGGRRITLDAFASRVWVLLDGQPTLPMLVEGLREDGAQPEQLAEDVMRLLSGMHARGLITWR